MKRFPIRTFDIQLRRDLRFYSLLDTPEYQKVVPKVWFDYVRNNANVGLASDGENSLKLG